MFLIVHITALSDKFKRHSMAKNCVYLLYTFCNYSYISFMFYNYLHHNLLEHFTTVLY